MPQQYVDIVAQRAAEKAAEEQARAAARDARRQQEAERAQRQAADSAAASQFLQGRVRQKASRFADLVGSMQEQQEERNPYRSRQEDEETSSPLEGGPGRQQQRGAWEPQRGASRGEQARGDSSYLPPDVIRVSRRAPETDNTPSGVWIAGSEGGGAWQQASGDAAGRAETEEPFMQEIELEEERRKSDRFMQEEGGGAPWADEIVVEEPRELSPLGGDKEDSFTQKSGVDEYIDW